MKEYIRLQSFISGFKLSSASETDPKTLLYDTRSSLGKYFTASFHPVPCVLCVPACQHTKSLETSQFYVPTCKKKHATLPKVCQIFNLACQRAKGLPIFQLGVPTCQKACQFFYYFLSEKVFQFSNFSIMLNICKSQEYLENSRKFI